MNKLARATSTYDRWKTTEPEWLEPERDETADREARRRFSAYLAEMRGRYEREVTG